MSRAPSHPSFARDYWDSASNTLAPHDFSILYYWLDELPERVAALSRDCILPGNPDVFIDLAYPCGTIAHVELSWLAPSKLRRTAIVGSEKMVIYDDTSTESVRVFDSGASLRDPATFGEYRLTYRTGDVVSPRIDASEPLFLQFAEFRSAILHGAPLRSSAKVGLDVVRTIEAVDSSLASGGLPVALDGEPLTEQSLEKALDVYAGRINGGDPTSNEGASSNGHRATARSTAARGRRRRI